MKNIFRFLSLILLTTAFYGCKDDIMDVPNENNPNFKNVYARGEDVEKVASGLFKTAFQGEHYASGVMPMLGVAADNTTCSWGNFAMRDMSWEPRDHAWDNSPTYSNNTYTKYSFDKWYSSIVTAATVIKAINEGANIGTNGADNDRTKAFARFAMGLAYGDLALVYDRAFLVDETKTVEGTLDAAVSYKEIATAALGYLEEAMTLSNSNFTIPKSWLGTNADMSNADFKKLVSTTAARLLAYVPRNKTELAQVDWNKVKTYADNGITSDFNVVQDNDSWVYEAATYLTYSGWGRTDMYVVHMMDPTMPQHWDDSPSFPHPAESTAPIDQRLKTDFEYLSFNDFQPARGYYHFTCYRWNRYDEELDQWIGPKPYYEKAENDMLRAEARAYLGDLQGAADIINAGTRTTRGQMEPVAANLADVLQAIHHERHVELYVSGMGLQFFEMRKRDLLQKGTPLHLPLPAQTLQTMGLKEFYTFGTVAKADGTNTSNSGWR